MEEKWRFEIFPHIYIYAFKNEKLCPNGSLNDVALVQNQWLRLKSLGIQRSRFVHNWQWMTAVLINNNTVSQTFLERRDPSGRRTKRRFRAFQKWTTILLFAQATPGRRTGTCWRSIVQAQCLWDEEASLLSWGKGCRRMRPTSNLYVGSPHRE